MQSAALVIRKIVTFVVGNQIDDRPLWQCCRLVQDEPPLFDARSERAHVSTVGFSSVPGKRSRHQTEPLDLVKPGGYVVPTRWHWGHHDQAMLAVSKESP